MHTSKQMCAAALVFFKWNQNSNLPDVFHWSLCMSNTSCIGTFKKRSKKPSFGGIGCLLGGLDTSTDIVAVSESGSFVFTVTTSGITALSSWICIGSVWGIGKYIVQIIITNLLC